MCGDFLHENKLIKLKLMKKNSLLKFLLSIHFDGNWKYMTLRK